MVGVVNEVPVPSGLPPVGEEYQVIVPPLVAPRIIIPESQIESVIVPVIVGVVFTVAITAVLEETQLPVVTST